MARYHLTYASEIFPLDIRMLCVAVTTADTWLGSFLIARTTPYMITGLGYGMYFVFAAILLAMGVWAFFFIPETKGVSLEEMDALFAQSTVKTTWAQLRGRSVFHRGDSDSKIRDQHLKEKELEVAQLERQESAPEKL